MILPARFMHIITKRDKEEGDLHDKDNWPAKPGGCTGPNYNGLSIYKRA